jgi:hypothetical protein
VTESVPAGDSRSMACGRDASGFAIDAEQFVARFADAEAYSADQAYQLLHAELKDYEARACAPELLGATLKAGLSPLVRRALLDKLPSTDTATVRWPLRQANLP